RKLLSARPTTLSVCAGVKYENASISSPVDGLTVVNPALFISGRPSLAKSQHLDELRSNRMIGPRILTSDELAIGNHVGREIDRPGDHLAASSCERVRHVEIQLRVKDVVLDPLLF